MEHKVEWENKICTNGNHEWDIYIISTKPNLSSLDIEQSGICKKCGYKTHPKNSYRNLSAL